MANILEIIIKATNQSGPGLSSAQSSISGFASSAASSLKSIELIQVAQQIEKIGDAIQRFGKEVIDTAQQYTIQVEEFARATGVSAEEASRLIQVADDQRVSVGELTTAVRVYSQQMAKAGINTQFNVEEIAKLSDEYLTLAPGTERNAFLMEKFGRSGLSMARMMEQGGDAIRGLSKDIDDNLIVTQEAIDSQRKYEEAMDDLQDALAGVKVEFGRALMEALPAITKFLNDVAIPILEKLVDVFVNLPDPIKNTTVALGGLAIVAGQLAPSIIGIMGLLNFLKGPGKAAGGAGGAAGAAGLASKLVLPALVIAGAIVEVKMVDFFAKAGAKAGKALGDALGVSLPPELEKLQSLMIEKGPLSGEVWKGFTDQTKISFMGVLSEASTAAGQLISIFGYSGALILEQFSGHWDTIKGVFAIGWQELITRATTSSQQLVTIVQLGAAALLLDASTSAQQLIAIAQTLGSQAIEAFNNWISEVKKRVSDFWRNLLDTARSMASNVGDWFRSVGDAIIRGIWEGIQAGWDWLVDQVTSLAQSLLDAAKAALNISSPSKEFARQVGAPIAAGILEGFKQGMKLTGAQMSGILSGITVPAGEGMFIARRGIVAGGAGMSIDVRKIEYHGSFSDNERKWLRRNQRDVAMNTLLEALGG